VAPSVRRGDVVVVDLDPTDGSERRGTRPRLAAQNDVGNGNAPTTIVVPFTTSFGEQSYPFEVLVPAEMSAVREDSIAVCCRIRTVPIEHLGSIPRERMDEAGTALEYSPGFTEV
jgi:mRNA interferase MazF